MEPSTLICHTCDTPACVNPDHLFPGSAKDNVQDSLAKGRWLVGEKRPNTHLTDDEAQTIRTRRASGELLRVLAAEYAVSEFCIYAIAVRKTWRHLP